MIWWEANDHQSELWLGTSLGSNVAPNIAGSQRAEGYSARSDGEGIVNRVLPKRPRQHLDPELYDRLREQVLRRDGWRCRSCGARSNLEVHHMELRGQGGDDA